MVNNYNCCHQMYFETKMHQISISAEAPPQTPLGGAHSQRSPGRPSWI